jgi:excisionase family DNA binding protein
MSEPIITTTQAAARLGVDAATARRWCETGRLPATKAGRDWLIAERDLAGFTQPKRGRPRGTQMTKGER